MLFKITKKNLICTNNSKSNEVEFSKKKLDLWKEILDITLLSGEFFVEEN